MQKSVLFVRALSLVNTPETPYSKATKTRLSGKSLLL